MASVLAVSDRIETARQYARGVYLWVRHGPRRALEAVSDATGLPRGFWFVAAVAGLLGALTAFVTITLAYRYHNHVPPQWVESDEA